MKSTIVRFIGGCHDGGEMDINYPIPMVMKVVPEKEFDFFNEISRKAVQPQFMCSNYKLVFDECNFQYVYVHTGDF